MSAEDITSGLMLGRYELLVPIAKGGTASVWAARLKGPRGFEKIVAVKIMLSEFGEDPDAETMFLDEARLVSRIRHANVAEVLDLGEEGEALFIVMEWVDGEPLHVIAREAQRRGGLPPAVIGQIGKQVCAGLHAAHDLRDPGGKTVGLVHRDVSPQNLLVGYDGMVKVIDFGVAKAASNQLRTSVGQLKGKVGYMAPEQALGEPVDRRTDVFALGIVLYQLLSGKNPFRGDNEYATLGRIRDKRPADALRTLVPALPEAVDRVVMRALEKSRDARYADMMELAHAIEEAFPPLEKGGEALAAYMGALLGPRGEVKRLAIREAIARADENQPPPSKVPAAFDLTAADPEDDPTLVIPNGMARRALDPAAAQLGAPAGGEIEVAVDEDAPTAQLPRYQGLPFAEAGPFAAPAGSSEAALPDFRPKRLGLKVTAAAMAIVLAIGLAIWGASGDSASSSETSSGSPVGKKPW
ncbi:MAG: serine/threonine-protein kinase [Minicystis sp.]